MGSHSHSRRDVLNSIVILGSSALLRPLHAQRTDTSAPAVIKGKLTDAATGELVAAKIRVVETDAGEEFMPAGAIRTMPKRTAAGGRHYFYARGSYEIAVPPGRYMIGRARNLPRSGDRIYGSRCRHHACHRLQARIAAGHACGRLAFGKYPHPLPPRAGRGPG